MAEKECEMEMSDVYYHKHQAIVNQCLIVQQSWKAFCETPVVDDDFTDMRERYELDIQRLKRLLL